MALGQPLQLRGSRPGAKIVSCRLTMHDPVCSFFFFRDKGFPFVETWNSPPFPCSQRCWQCWLTSWFDSLSSFILGPSSKGVG